jgi:hypothetical protein
VSGKIEFDDFTIREIFGTDTAEDENPDRLKSYFFKNKAYSNIRANLPLRILVGHKGIGKSALLRMAYIEDKEESSLALWLQPNDLVISSAIKQSFIEKIEGYKHLLSKLIYEKSLESLNISPTEKDRFHIQSTTKQLVSSMYQRVISLSGANVDEEVKLLRERFTHNKKIRVYIDDIDRGWSASQEDINNVSALMNAARDMANEENTDIQFRIGLRSDAYFLYRTSDESTDKIESNVVRLMWTRHDILVVAALRVARYFGREIDIAVFEKQSQKTIGAELNSVIENRFSVGRGHWDGAPIHVVLLSLVRNRPRDLVKLLTEAAKEAYRNNHSLISSTDLENVFSNYSHGRITDLTLEFKSELPAIEKLLYNMAPTTKQNKEKSKRWLYTNDEIINKLKNIMSNQTLQFRNGSIVSPKSLAEFLFKIDFIIARSEDDAGQVNDTRADAGGIIWRNVIPGTA